MEVQRAAIALTVVNLTLLAVILGRELPTLAAAAAAGEMLRASPSVAQEVVPILRGRALELVDESGQVRTRLSVEPDGEVVLRLIDRHRTIRVKLGADESGSALLLLDEATEPGVHMIARRTGTAAKPATTSVTLRGPGGQTRAIRP